MGCDYYLFCQVFDFSFFILVLCPKRLFCIFGLAVVVLNACSGVSPSLAMLIISSTSQRAGLCLMVWMQSCTYMWMKFHCMLLSWCLKTFICLFILGSGFVWSIFCIQLIFLKFCFANFRYTNLFCIYFPNMQTRGLKHGRAIVVSTCAAVASILTGVLAGMLALGERLPSAPKARFLLLLGW